MELEEDLSTSLRFHPPVYRQRYEAVLELSRRLQPKKVVDMGCAECNLLKSLKFHKHIEWLLGVDLDGALLRAREHLMQPLIADYLIRRANPLNIKLLKGSIAEPDARLLNCDLFACIEVIEHLEESVLNRVPAVVFQMLRPTVAIVSTPNADFNVLFPDLVGFRHYDHKFEWSRQEFQNWCFKICSLYNYEVTFGGVGDPPAGMSHLGYCSQIAIFKQLTVTADHVPDTPLISRTPYELIYECDYPYEPHPPSPEQALNNEAEYYLRILLQRERNVRLVDSDSDAIENGHAGNYGLTDSPRRRNYISICLTDLLVFPRIQELTSSVEHISEVLQQYSTVVLSEDGMSAVFYEDEEEISENELNSDDNEEEREITATISYTQTEPEESWD